MLILAFDTALAACSAALWESGTHSVLAHAHERRARGHAEALGPMIERVLGDAGCSVRDVGRIGVTTGPGTFAGVRIGIAMARGMALAADIPVVGVTTLRAVAGALSVPADSRIASIFDARRGELYAQCFGPSHTPLTEPLLCRPDQLPGIVGSGPVEIVGSGSRIAEPVLRAAGVAAVASAADSEPDAAILARFAAAEDGSGSLPEPLYLRAPDAKLAQTAGSAGIAGGSS